jgi:hypothetical protein
VLDARNSISIIGIGVMRKLLASGPKENEIAPARQRTRQMRKKEYLDGTRKRHPAESCDQEFSDSAQDSAKTLRSAVLLSARSHFWHPSVNNSPSRCKCLSRALAHAITPALSSRLSGIYVLLAMEASLPYHSRPEELTESG